MGPAIVITAQMIIIESHSIPSDAVRRSVVRRLYGATYSTIYNTFQNSEFPRYKVTYFQDPVIGCKYNTTVTTRIECATNDPWTDSLGHYSTYAQKFFM